MDFTLFKQLQLKAYLFIWLAQSDECNAVEMAIMHALTQIAVKRPCGDGMSAISIVGSDCTVKPAALTFPHGSHYAF